MQLYVGDPESSLPRPPKELKGFEKVELQPGEAKPVTFELAENGGHVGFVAGGGLKPQMWLQKRIHRFLNEQLFHLA